jgi:tRNA A-37 threonylcarbamoyl transferase component Bud32
MDKIPARFPVLDPVINAKVHVPLPLKKKWAAQIESTVNDLHRHGIIWGDAKPTNIIIDEYDDVWLIDFGGGFTPGWVERSLAGSAEGDLQAVKKLKDKLESE